MGWVWLLAIGFAAFAALWWGGVSRSLMTLVGSALLLGGVGYALQQSAGLPGSPAIADIQRVDVDPGMVGFRTAIMPGTAEDRAILAAADDAMRAGDTDSAVQGIMRVIDQRPDNALLWTGLAMALVAHDNGQISPAAKLAFGRAVRLAPREPGPPFFRGLAQVQAGDLAAAKSDWLRALALAPREAPYRVLIAERLVMIDRFIAMQAEGTGAVP